jgi:hypothetical protein
MKQNPNIPRVTFRVINPADNSSVNAAEWLKQPEEVRTTAEWISFETDRGDQFLMHKSKLPDANWRTQQEAVKKVHPDGRGGTRYEFLLVQYARENFETNLDELLEAIGGDDLNDWFWTEESFASSANGAWVFNGNGNGNLSDGNARFSAFSARVFRAF